MKNKLLVAYTTKIDNGNYKLLIGKHDSINSVLSDIESLFDLFDIYGYESCNDDIETNLKSLYKLTDDPNVSIEDKALAIDYALEDTNTCEYYCVNVFSDADTLLDMVNSVGNYEYPMQIGAMRVDNEEELVYWLK